MTLYVLLYEPVADVMERAPAHFPAHRARLDACHRQGTLLMMGAFANPVEEGSMAIFTSRQAAEEFVAGDPFVLEGVVRRWHIREWDEQYVRPAPEAGSRPSSAGLPA